MTQHDLVKLVAFRCRLTQKATRAALSVAFETIERTVRKTGRFEWKGIGVFYLKKHKSRLVMNPQTYRLMRVPATWKLGFRAADALIRRR